MLKFKILPYITKKIVTQNNFDGRSYFVSASVTNGQGTFDNPFGINDILDPITLQIGAAMTILEPGDTLYFRGGTYTFNVSYNAAEGGNILIFPSKSGTASRLITLRSYPGEVANLVLAGDTSRKGFIGTSIGPARSYIRFLGLKITVTAVHDYNGTYGTIGPFAIKLSGVGNEVAYCELECTGTTTFDNHTCLWVDGDTFHTADLWIHHNVIHRVSGSPDLITGFQLYGGIRTLFEENYITDCNYGIFYKATGTEGDGTGSLTCRNNYVNIDMSDPYNEGYKGPIEQDQGTAYFYDNVLTGTIEIGAVQNDSEFHNNLILQPRLNEGQYKVFQPGAASPTLYRTQIWNNIVFIPAASFPALFSYATSSTGVPPAISYMDYNFYTGTTPSYKYADITLNLAQIRASGYEIHSQFSIPSTGFYQDLVEYVLKPTWINSGKDGDMIGPRVAIGITSGVMNLAKYGPSAIGSYL